MSPHDLEVTAEALLEASRQLAAQGMALWLQAQQEQIDEEEARALLIEARKWLGSDVVEVAA